MQTTILPTARDKEIATHVKKKKKAKKQGTGSVHPENSW